MNHKDLTILFEDNHIIVVLKPQGVPSQGDNTGDADMLTIIKDYIKEKYGKPGNVFLGLVHRLDRPTGGVMVFAKTSKAAARLSEQVREGAFSKKYLAVTTSRPQDKAARLTHYLFKDMSSNTVRVVPLSTDGAKKAILDYNNLEDNEENDLHLLDVKLHTGRTHQIRVQTATIGCPIFADAKYGSMVSGGRLALWAYDLSFKHPTTEKIMSFRVFPPEAFPWSLFNLERHIGIKRPV